jgi:L-lactate dehydrogenase (cytochrome)
MTRLGACHNVSDFARAARQRLPAPLFDYIDGGADDEVTMAANTAAFDRYAFRPSYLRDVRDIDMRRTVLGRTLEWPLILAPTGMTKLFHPSGEAAVAAAAADSGAMYALSTMATTSIEDVARACGGAKIYQLYLLKDDELNFAMIDRCKAAGFDAICLTVDTIVAGNRERDLRNGLTVPPRLNLASLVEFARRPGWCVGYVRDRKFSLPNIGSGAGAGDVSTLAAYFAANMEANITWERLARLIDRWGKPFAIKGLQTVADARAAADAGATAVMISNHGGRQLDGVSATIDLVADIVDGVGDRIEVILDGGVRRGSHVVKALAMGARACMTGRPYLYALSAFGAAGVARMLSLVKAETARTLALLGCASLNDLDRGCIRAAAGLPEFLAADEHRQIVPHLVKRKQMS